MSTISCFKLCSINVTLQRIAAMSKLATKLSKQMKSKVPKGHTPTDQIKEGSICPDIEDAPNQSPYFSPLQTRQQRKFGLYPKQTILMRVKNARNTAITAPPTVNQIEIVSATSNAKQGSWEPKNWQHALENIRLMRSSASAPVDTMGCHKCSDDSADEKTQRYQKLVALMLSSQTKDETTFGAMQRLKQNGLSPSEIVKMDVSALEQLLHPVSFYKNKAKYLQKTSRILLDNYGGDIPDNIKDLIALPGVGPKMGHICMATAWDKVTGIGVDVHVHRITNRLKWVPQPTKEPEKTRTALESWLPRDLWREVNYLLVGFGQTVCTPVSPQCAVCLNRDICPAATQKGNKAISLIK